jgi:hypothetical protein
MSSYCWRRSVISCPEGASDFQDPQGINHSLAALYKLLASGQISPRRATGLAYIASLLLRTLLAINSQFDANKAMQYEIDVPPRGRVGCSEDEKPPTLPEPTSPGDPAAQACLPAVTGLLQQASATEVPKTPARLPACRGRPASGHHSTSAPVAGLGRPVIREIPVPQRSGFPSHPSTTYVETSL